MLARLSIRDIVLIERLDIEFAKGLAVLTGETGAGKSILLDAFALAFGGGGDATLVRHGAEQGQVTAVFDVPKDHPASVILPDSGDDVLEARVGEDALVGGAVDGLACVLRQLRLGVETLDVADAAAAEDPDDGPGLGRAGGVSPRSGGAADAVLVEHGGQGQPGEAHAGVGQEGAA